MLRSLFACLALIFLLGWLGRSRKPFVSAFLIEPSALSSDFAPFLPRQTTRTSPGPSPVIAECSERAFGTLPPAGGLIDLSGRGSGQ